MPVISGTLKNASGVRPNTQIILRAVKTSGSVIKNAPDLSIKTDINGRYSFDCNPCTYHVQIMQQGHQREDAGVINVYTDTPNTSIELLLNELKEDDLTPEVIKQVEAFRSEILGYQQAAEQAAAQAKTNADKAASDNATLQQTVNTQLNAVNSSLAAKLDKTATAENSLKLGNVAASDYARSSAVVNLTGDQSVSGVKTFSGYARATTDPATGNDLARKSYIDNNFAEKGAGGVGVSGGAGRWENYAAVNDLNETLGVANGIYSTNLEAGNAPSGSTNAGLLVHQTWSDVSVGQIFTGFHGTGTNRMWFRTRQTDWREWRELAGVDSLPFQGNHAGVTTNRLPSVNYTNNTGKPLIVTVSTITNTPTNNSELMLVCSGVPIQMTRWAAVSGVSNRHAVSGVIPVGEVYSVTAGNCEIATWRELN